jgi:hypothetical protein
MYSESEAYKLPPNVRIPIGARDLIALREVVGAYEEIAGAHAVLVTPRPQPHFLAGTALGQHPNARTRLSSSATQVWAHVDYQGYRGRYKKGRPSDSIDGLVLDHVLNRRLARELGYLWLRLCPVTWEVNGQGGNGLEDLAVWNLVERRPGVPLERLKGKDGIVQPPLHAPDRVAYAGAFEICKMLNVPPGEMETNPMVQQIYALMHNHGSRTSVRDQASRVTR